MVRGFLFVLVGNVLRLGAGLLIIVLLARRLGPEGFGVFAYGLALAALGSVPLNFGMSTAVLRRFGAEPERAAPALGEALSAKLLLLGPLLLASLLGSLLLPGGTAAVFVALLLAQAAESFGEIYQLGFRAASRYKEEAAAASRVAIVHLAVMGLVAWAWPQPLPCALAFLASRMAGLAMTGMASQRAFARLRPAGMPAAWAFLRSSTAYAVEFGLTTANSQLDAVFIQGQLGVRSVGLYQAGMKLVQGVSRLAPILALYLLPRLTRRVQAGARGQALLTLTVFGSIGALSGGVLALGAEPLTHLLFGERFVELSALLPWFGLLLALRFLETGAGLVLVAADLQGRKVWLVAVQLVLLLGLGWWALGRWGLLGWLWVAIGSTLVLLALYALLWRRHQAGGRAASL